MIIKNNVAANNSYVPYSTNLKGIEKAAKRLASGDKFANPSEGQGDLSVAEKLRLRVVGTQTTLSGMTNALGYSSTQDDILGQVSDIIARMKELASSAVDPTKDAADRSALNTEFRALDDEISDLASNSKYNGTRLFETATTIRVGLETTDTVSYASIRLEDLTFAAMSLNNLADASAAITTLDTRMGSLNSMRISSRTQAMRVERAMTIAQGYISNLQNSHSAIRDIDLAKETGDFTKKQVNMSASQAILAQANSLPQNAVQFLQF